MTPRRVALLGSLGLLLAGCGSTPEPRTGVHTSALRREPPAPAVRTEQAAGYRADLEASPAMTVKERALAEQVLDRVRQHPYAGSAAIAVSARRGLIRLTGTVGNDLQRRSAEQVALQVEGVERVVNDLAIAAPEEHRNTERLASALAQELRKAGVDPQLLDLRIEQGVVTVGGRLDDWDTYDRVMVAIYRAGPKEVNNQLQVSTRTDRVEFVVPDEPTTASDRAAQPGASAPADPKETRGAADDQDAQAPADDGLL